MIDFKTSLFLTLVVLLVTVPMPQSRADYSRQSVSGPRQALIIGNSNYQHFPKLRNPIYDAKAVDQALTKLGFKTKLLLDASQEAMESAIDKFGRDLDQGGVGLFYYAGHGIQYKNQNYLIPASANISTSQKLRYKSVNLTQVLDSMEHSKSKINIVVLDACRNNPLPAEKRSATRGLARVQSSKGTLIAYATSPGMTAEDGRGRNGTYTKHFLKALNIPNIPIEITFKRVREGVDEETRGTQTPWESSSIVGNFVINPVEGERTASSSSRFVPAPNEPTPTVIPESRPKTIVAKTSAAKTSEEKLADERSRLAKYFNQQGRQSNARNEETEIGCSTPDNKKISCLKAGNYYMQSGSREKAKQAYVNACSAENMQACEKLGDWYLSAHAHWDRKKALQYFSQACDEGLDKSCEHAKHLKILASNEKLCDSGNYDSCYMLGQVYSVPLKGELPSHFASQFSHYVQQDDDTAFVFLKKACSGANHYEACYTLANRYRLGKGTKQNFAVALKLYNNYCNGEFESSSGNSNNLLSCYQLGQMYHLGQGVSQDADQATKYYRLACNEHQGVNSACEALAGLP